MNEIVTQIEKAWREGYSAGYHNGSNDASHYEWGGGSNKSTERDKNEEWNDSEAKEFADKQNVHGR